MTNETTTRREPVLRLRGALNDEQIDFLLTAIRRLNSRGREVLRNVSYALKALEPGDTIVIQRFDEVAFEAQQKALRERSEARDAARKAEHEAAKQGHS
jgi:hypothetical protein